MDDELDAALAKIQDALDMTTDLKHEVEMTASHNQVTSSESHVTMSLTETRSVIVTEEYVSQRSSVRQVQGTDMVCVT